MSQPKTHITAIKAFSDNYIWALINSSTNELTLVDPGDATPCIKYIEAHNLQLVNILITHHHIDHVGGIDKLRSYCDNKAWPLTIYGPAFQPLANSETLPIPKKHNTHTDIIVNEHECVYLAAHDLNLTVMSLTGHTLEHIAYYNEQMIFCGDTLFSGGCGRIFEGSAQQMFQSLNKIAKLPASTQIYCSHEYTQSNLQFAIAAEPDNAELIAYYNKVIKIRAAEQSTLPTNIATELAINPFLRSHLDSIKNSVSSHTNQTLNSPLSVFTALRQWKDTF